MEPAQIPPTHAASVTHSPIPMKSQRATKRKLHKPKAVAELALPSTDARDAEDQEIEWLEWALKKEKGKGKATETEDGLDGKTWVLW